MQEVLADETYLLQRNAGGGVDGSLNPLSEGIIGIQDGNGGANGDKLKHVYLDKSFPINPVAGLHVIRIGSGEHLTSVMLFSIGQA